MKPTLIPDDPTQILPTTSQDYITQELEEISPNEEDLIKASEDLSLDGSDEYWSW